MLEVAFVISVCQIVRLCFLPDTHKEWLRIRDGPSYIHLSLYGLPMEAPCLPLRLISSLSQRGPSWILRAMHVRGALL